MGTEIEETQEQREGRDWELIGVIVLVIATAAINLGLLVMRTVYHVHGGPI